MQARHDTADDDAQTETETTTDLDHPLATGTVFTTAGGRIVKVINDRKQFGRDMWSYTTITYNGAHRSVTSQTDWDLDTIVRDYGWKLDAVPGEVSSE